MDVSFNGIKNVGVLTIRAEKNVELHRIFMQLDNNGTKDLDNFKSILQHFKFKKPDFMQVDLFIPRSGQFIPNEIYINGQLVKPIPEYNEFLSYFAGFLNKMATKPEKEILPSLDYVYRGDFKEDMFPIFTNERELIEPVSNEVFFDYGITKKITTLIADACIENKFRIESVRDAKLG